MSDARGTDPQVIHQDDDLLVIDKPPGLPTTAPGPHDRSLVRWVHERFPALRAHPTSRLDALVSGLVTFALSAEANRRLLEARRTGSYERVYLGIVLQSPEPRRGEWKWPISIDPRKPTLRVGSEGRGQREALTRYEIKASTNAGVLLMLMPRTGRTHQLRVHASTAGAPLFGDHAYGGERRRTLPDGTVVTARRVMLHCARVRLPWPPHGARQFDAPAHADMQRAWSGLGGDASDLVLQC